MKRFLAVSLASAVLASSANASLILELTGSTQEVEVYDAASQNYRPVYGTQYDLFVTLNGLETAAPYSRLIGTNSGADSDYYNGTITRSDYQFNLISYNRGHSNLPPSTQQFYLHLEGAKATVADRILTSFDPRISQTTVSYLNLGTQSAGFVPGESIAITGVRIASFTNGTIVQAVPEPVTWAMLIGGVGVTGAAMRRRQRTTAIPA